MKTANLLAVAIATFASLPLMAQQISATGQQSVSTSAAGSSMNSSAQADTNAHASYRNTEANGSASTGSSAAANPRKLRANGSSTGILDASGRHGASASGASASGNGYAAGTAEMRPVAGELQNKLDAKSARVGEPVVLKTTRKTKTADGAVLPKGSRLLGHVTEVQAHGKGHENSSLSIVFDHAQLKNGQTMAIRSMIESVQPSPAAIAARAMENDDAMASAAPMGGGMVGGGPAMGGGGMVGGGLVGGGAGLVGNAGGMAGGMMGHSGSAMGQAAGNLDASTNGALRSTDNLAGNATANVGRGIGASEGVAGNLAAHATGIPGVMLAGSGSSATSGTLTAARRNVHLDSGTQMVVGIAAAGSR